MLSRLFGRLAGAVIPSNAVETISIKPDEPQDSQDRSEQSTDPPSLETAAIPSKEVEAIEDTPRESQDSSVRSPDVPRPEDTPSIQLIAAAWQCHDLLGEDMPRIAVDMLEAGYDTPGLRQLAGETQVHSSADVEDLVARIFGEFKVPYPLPQEQAQLILTRQIAREVIAGQAQPWDAGRYIEKTLWGSGPANQDLAALFALNDGRRTDSNAERFEIVKTSELMEVFARLGRLTDEEIFAGGISAP